ncbi:MAG: DUF5333 domain-containing protein [Pararhodobacter sp.]
MDLSARVPGMTVKRALWGAVLAVALALGGFGDAAAQARTQAEVNESLRADPEIYAGLFSMGIAHGIREHCPAIEARSLRAHSLALSLYNRARSLGFSRDEIRAFLDDRGEKDFLRRVVTQYLTERGVQEADPETFCTQGRAEIAARSQAGTLLRAR